MADPKGKQSCLFLSLHIHSPSILLLRRIVHFFAAPLSLEGGFAFVEGCRWLGRQSTFELRARNPRRNLESRALEDINAQRFPGNWTSVNLNRDGGPFIRQRQRRRQQWRPCERNFRPPPLEGTPPSREPLLHTPYALHQFDNQHPVYDRICAGLRGDNDGCAGHEISRKCHLPSPL